jgi:ubiquinone/menaquinone biosynthesis C-methylase UbiE
MWLAERSYLEINSLYFASSIPIWTDLSPAYLRKANQTLSQIPGELPQLLQANAEELPYLDNYFHAVTCVFLFHELPAAARQQIIEQCLELLNQWSIYYL